MDRERVQLVGRVMSRLGFQERTDLRHSDRTGPQFTDNLVFTRLDTNEEVWVSFPNPDEAGRGMEITTEAHYCGKATKQWSSLREFAEKVASWLEERRHSG